MNLSNYGETSSNARARNEAVMNFFKAPIDALYNLNFYRQAMQTSFGKSLLYLAYLAAIGTVVLFLSLTFVLFPMAEKFIVWIGDNLPAGLVYSNGMLNMNSGTTYTLTHPTLGTLAYFDMTKADVTEADFQGAPLLVTSSALYARQKTGIQSYDFSDFSEEGENPGEPTLVDAQMLNKVLADAKPWLVGTVMIAALPVLFLFKWMMVVIYTGMGMVINLLRNERLPYSSVFAVTSYAITPATLLGYLVLLFPAVGAFTLGLIGDLMITAVYLYIGLKLTETQGPAI